MTKGRVAYEPFFKHRLFNFAVQKTVKLFQNVENLLKVEFSFALGLCFLTFFMYTISKYYIYIYSGEQKVRLFYFFIFFQNNLDKIELYRVFTKFLDNFINLLKIFENCYQNNFFAY